MSGRQPHAPVRSGFVQLHDGRKAQQPAHASHPTVAVAPTAAAAFHGGGQGDDHEGHHAPEALDSYEAQHLHDNITEAVAHTSGEDDVAPDIQAGPRENNRDGVNGDNDEEENEENEDDSAEHNFPELFESWDELESYIREFAAQSYQVFRIRSTVSVRARNANLLKLKKNIAAADGGSSVANNSPSMLLADAWKFYSKTYTCTHGLSYQPSEKRLQKSAPLAVRASGCKARINASVSYNKAEKRHCVRAVVRGWHNHPTDREKYYSYVENRRITDPALVDTIARLEGQGEKAKAIYDVLARHVLETTGKECVFQQQDVRNVVFRLQTEKRKQKKARVAASAPDVIRQFINDAHQQQRERDNGGDDEYNDYREASVDELTAYPREYSAANFTTNQVTHELDNNSRVPKRKTRAPRMAVPPAMLEALERPNDAQTMKLSRLEMMMDSASCYALSHGYVGHMAVVAVETVPKRITKFKHEVVRIPPSFQIEDVNFVLPKYVVDGCEQRIVDTCRGHRLLPPAVGVTLSVQKRGSQTTESVTLTSRQLRTMKRYYFASETMTQVRKFNDWISFMSPFEARHSNIPFDEYYNDPKVCSHCRVFTHVYYGLADSVLLTIRFTGLPDVPAEHHGAR